MSVDILTARCTGCSASLSQDETIEGWCHRCDDIAMGLDGFDDGEDEDEDEGIDCGMGPDGLCSNAGTEWCDFDCPHGG